MLSVIIPAHNEEKQLGETLEALRLALEGFPVEVEVIVVDDDSTDATAEIARAWGARVERVEFRHIAATRNAGARVGKGDWLVFLDADTRVRAEHFQEAGCAMSRGWSGGARVGLDEPHGWVAEMLLKIFTFLYFQVGGLGAGCFLFTTRRAFEEAGGFDETFFAGEDADLSMRLKRDGKFHVIENPVTTSARKVRLYGPLKIALTIGRVLVLGKSGVRNRKGLEMWYDGRR